MDVSMRTTELPGRGRFEIAEWGAGTPVLCLHGFLDSWYSFAGLAAAAPDGVRLVAPSLRGHGESWKPAEGYAVPDMAADVALMIEALDVGPIWVLGHSMGSLVAQEVARTRPDLVRGLVLIGTALSTDTPDLRAAHAELSQLEDPVPREVGRSFQEGTCAGPLVGLEMDRIVDETAKVPARVWDRALAGLLTYRPAGAAFDLRAIACPVRILWGDRDAIFERAAQDDLLAALPRAELTILEGAGHGLHWERPQECADALARLLG